MPFCNEHSKHLTVCISGKQAFKNLDLLKFLLTPRQFATFSRSHGWKEDSHVFYEHLFLILFDSGTSARTEGRGGKVPNEGTL